MRFKILTQCDNEEELRQFMSKLTHSAALNDHLIMERSRNEAQERTIGELRAEIDRLNNTVEEYRRKGK